jgi:ATP-binding protein involved in chromosome partitioning
MLNFTLKKKILSEINHYSSATLNNRTILELGFKINLKISSQKLLIIIESDREEDFNWQKINQELENQIQLLHKFDKIDFVINTHKKSPSVKPITNPHQDKKIILICSAKGGVGKSTLAANLAIANSSLGRKTALIDADIYGPSIHLLLGTMQEKPQIKDNLMTPIEAHNIKLNSMGMITPADKALIWRGPMLGKALDNLLNHTNWGDSEYLFIDLPPGTGDVYLTLLKKYSSAQAILISTPQKISLIDVSRSVNLLKKLNINILGVIENMAHVSSINNVKKFAHLQNISYLGKISYNPKIAQYCDNSQPAILDKRLDFYQEIMNIVIKL